jgi:cytochrome c-type biogenesis protein CcmH/NrfF
MQQCDSSTPYFAIVNNVASRLHCSVCSGQNIASSDATFARNVRTDICAYAYDGMSEDAIMQNILADYGEGIKLQTANAPEMQYLNIALLLILVFSAVIGRKIFKRKNI